MTSTSPSVFIGFAGALAVAASGCLSSTHVIPQSELQRLARIDPQERGNSVRVVQSFASDDGPPRAPEVQHNTVVVVDGGHHHGHRGSVSSGGGKAPRQKNAGKVGSDDARFWLVAAAAVGVGLAVTEGARFDGWVQVHPMQPVHLYGPGGEYMWVPLAQLDAETAAWARKAFVRDGEGPWKRLQRARLDRRGWTYSVLFGGGEIPSSTGSNAAGAMGHIQLGHFPLRELGVLFDVGLGWRDDENGAVVYDSRYGLELQVLPFSVGAVHAGGYGAGGLAHRFDDGYGSDNTGAYLGAGVLLQLEATTHLAITARAGITSIYDTSVTDLTVGLSIY